MAEAVTATMRFFCHMCNVEINIPNTDYTCPLCAGGFVEELPANALPQPSASNSSNASDEMVSYNRLSGLDALRGDIATLLMSRNGPSVEISIDPGNRRGNLLTLGGGSGSNGSMATMGSSLGSGNTGGGRVRPQNLDRLDNVLLDFLQSISSGDVDAAPFGNSGMFYMGNLGDYAWGREGIDTIVTQLLNQMETSGPPPLAKDKIAEIPKVEVTAEDVERKLQCSVCWEDFRLQEQVRRLPCAHIYHENCIVPWLDLHGTCPICRKSLTDEDGGDNDIQMEGVGGSTSRSATQCPVHRNASPIGGGTGLGSTVRTNSSATATTSAAAPGSTSQTQQQQQQQRNNIFAFDDGNVDLD